MSKDRVLAFSDGVLAIVITIMVLELKVPHGDNFSSLIPLAPIFMSYVLSFIHVGIYWNNHHHLMQVVSKINGKILWANLNLLFWLTLFPFATGFMGENNFSSLPVAIYGCVLLMGAVSWSILSHLLINLHGKNSVLAAAYGKDFKGNISIIIYLSAIALTFVNAWIGVGLYILVAVIWFIPDQRIERKVELS